MRWLSWRCALSVRTARYVYAAIGPAWSGNEPYVPSRYASTSAGGNGRLSR